MTLQMILVFTFWGEGKVIMLEWTHRLLRVSGKIWGKEKRLQVLISLGVQKMLLTSLPCLVLKMCIPHTVLFPGGGVVVVEET